MQAATGRNSFRMANLKTDGLGTVLVVDRSNVFYKLLPFRATDEVLQNYDVTVEMYRQHFTARAPISCVSRGLFNKMLNKSPDRTNSRQLMQLPKSGTMISNETKHFAPEIKGVKDPNRIRNLCLRACNYEGT